MDIKEFARLGGQARARNLPASKRKQIAINAANKRWNRSSTLASKHCPHGNPSRAQCSACYREDRK